MPSELNSFLELEKAGNGDAFLQSMLGSTADCLKILDLEGRIVWMSDNGQKLLGVSDFSTIKNSAWLNLVKDPASRGDIEKALHLARDGQISRFRGFCPTLTGIPKWWDVVVTPVIGKDGKTEHLLSASREITGIRQTEQELEQARIRLDATLASAEIGTWTWDIPANEVIADKNLARLFSIPSGRGPVESFVSAIHPDDLERVKREITAALSSRSGLLETDYRVLFADGSVRWITARGKVQFDSEGNPVQFPGVVIDITDRKKQEQAIQDLTGKMQAQTRLFDATLSNISDLAYTFNREAQVIYANKPLLDIWGLSLEQAVGKNCFDLNYPDELATRLNGELLHVIATGKTVRGETVLASAAGVIDYHEYIYNPVFAEDGTIVAVTGTTRLVTHRKKREKTLLEQSNMIALRAEINMALNRSDTTREILQRCADSFAAHLSRTAVRIWTFDLHAKKAELQAFAGINASLEDEKDSTATEKFRFHFILEQRETFLSNNLEDAPEWVKEDGMQAFAGYPLLQGDRILGLVTFYSREIFSETAIQEIPPLMEAITQWIRRRETEEQVRKSEEQLRLALSAANLGDWQWEPDTELVTLSPRAAEIFGVPPGRHMTRDELRELIHPEDRPLAVQAATTATTPGCDYDIEYRINRRDGSMRWVAAKGRYIYGEDGAFVSMLGVVQDITERKKETAAHQYLAAIVASSEDAVLSKDLNGVLTSWNAGAERLFGYTADEIIGKSILTLIPLELRDEEPGILNRIRSGQAIEHYETARMHKDGHRIDVSLTVSPIKDGSNRIIGASKIARNITEQKKIEAELHRRERLYRAIGDSIDYGIWVCDGEGKNTYASSSFLKLVGLTQAECSETGWGRVLHPDDVDATLAAWQKVCREGSFWEREHRFKGVDGKWHPILARGVPVHDDEGKIVSWVGINLDIMAFKQAEEKLKQARAELLKHAQDLEQRVDERTAELKETNSQLETLVYSIAHDLRAPLRSMQAYAKTLLDDYAPLLDDTAQHYAQRIVNSAENMDALVLDLLAYGRIARSEMTLDPLDLESIWQSVVAQYENDIQEKKATIETLPPLPSVMGNEVALAQALANLLGNALKFVAPGVTPLIRFRTEEKGEMIRIWVEDNGIGIAPEYQERIFRVFERLQGQSYPGTGIGLSIVRKGIERMGGSSGVESNPGKGSSFWIELPKSRA